MTDSRHRWWWFLGPWPVRPALLTMVMLAVYISYVGGFYGNRVLLDREVLLSGLLPGLPLAVIVYSVAKLGERWQRKRGVHWPSYLLTMVVLSAVGPTSRAIGFAPAALPSQPLFVGTSVFRAFVVFFTVSAVLGTVLDRLERQVRATQDALAVAREQQVQMLTTDEEARRQVSLLLHDRVQAGLLTTGMQLRALANRLPESERRELLAVQEQLETIRAIDVRGAARALSPNLDDVDLQTALEDLASQYEVAFATDIRVDADLERDLMQHAPFTALACYRIVDQALMNIAAHAQATAVTVTIDRAGDAVALAVRDNGRGLPPQVTPGLGSAIITTWVRATHGTWDLAPQPDGPGTELSARINRQASVNHEA